MKARALALGVAALATGPFIGATAAQAAPASSTAHTVYVSTNARSSASDRSCATPAFSSIGKAVDAVAAGGKVIVCGGTFHEDVSLAKTVTLEGRSHATIDAGNQINGVKITAPHVTVSGFTVKNAIGEGVLVQNASYATVQGNNVTGNNTGVRLQNPVSNTYAFCQTANGVPGDCGESIHLLGATNATIQGNNVTDGAGGILLSDETGPTAHNLISGNVVADNHTACGIVLAGHSPTAAPGGVPAPAAGGIYDNTVRGNNVYGNGLQGTGGAGVQMATGLPGGAVYKNTVTGNVINGNGHGGVTLHSHVPGQYLDGNVVTYNQIGSNNVNGDDEISTPDPEKTGVIVGTVNPLTIQITGNIIGPDHYGIFTAGPVTVTQQHNIFVAVKTAVSKN